MWKSRKKFAEVARATSATGMPRNVAISAATCANVGRLVALAPVRNGREIRRVGLDQHPVERNEPGDLLQVLSILEGDDSRKGNVEAEIERRAGDVGGFGEAVHHATDLAGALLRA